jgi:hypothetical protein
MAGLAQMMSSPEMQNSMRQMFGGSGTRPTTRHYTLLRVRDVERALVGVRLSLALWCVC